jgi:hypothetical protein
MKAFTENLDGIETVDSTRTMGATEAHQMMISRNIAKEILDFGISQNQLFQVMGLLALEIENRDIMLRLVDVLKEAQEEHKVFKQCL